MSSPPQTPTSASRHHRKSSQWSLASSHGSLTNTPTRNSYTGGSSARRRRRSSASVSSAVGGSYSPVTPRSSHGDREFGADVNGFGSGGGGGLGSLADELGEEEWDEEGEEYDGGGDSLDFTPGEGAAAKEGPAHARKESQSVETDPSSHASATLSPVSARNGKRRHRRDNSRYDGSDYGDDSDFELSDAISPGLEARMAAVEGLARRGLEENGSSTDGVVARVTEELKDLGSQAGVESGATRLTTAHTALTTHLTHQTRTVTTLTSHIFSPLAPPPDPSLIDSILPLITSTISLIPPPPSSPLRALNSLTQSTQDLLDTLSYLSDNLQMLRQSTSTASRRLRGCRDIMAEWRREHESAEEARRWIERGDWDRRLRDREAKRVTVEVCGGFEEVCNGWREKLVMIGEREGVGAAA